MKADITISAQELVQILREHVRSKGFELRNLSVQYMMMGAPTPNQLLNVYPVQVPDGPPEWNITAMAAVTKVPS